MSVDFVRDTIKPELKEICREKGWSKKPQSLGRAFQYWVAKLITEKDPNIDLGGDDGQLYDRLESHIFEVNDLGIDILLSNPTDNRYYVLQTKFVENLSGDGAISHFHNLQHKLNYSYVNNSKATNATKQALVDYLSNVERDWQATWIFATIAKVTGNTVENFQNPQGNKKYVEFHIHDKTKLKEISKEVKSGRDKIPDEVTLNLPKDNYIHLHNEGRKTLVAVIKGNELRNIYDKHRESLISYNIRGFLGDKKDSINKKIRTTIEKEAENFFYFNNGISAICNSFEIQGGKLIAQKLQIINGGQTMGALWQAGPSDEVKILFRLTVVGKAKQNEFNENIIRYNNTQNVIKSSDFRSNDLVQKDLKGKFDDFKGSEEVLDKIIYTPKRGIESAPAKKGNRKLNLEKLAQIIYSYRENPYDVVERRKLLWEEDAKYNAIFGQSDDVMPNDLFEQFLLILSFYYAIIDKIASLKKEKLETGKSKEEIQAMYGYLSLARFHILGFAHIFIKSKGIPSNIWKKKDEFDKIFNQFWESQTDPISSIQTDAEEQPANRGSIGNLLRNKAYWEKISKKYRTKLNL